MKRELRPGYQPMPAKALSPRRKDDPDEEGIETFKRKLFDEVRNYRRKDDPDEEGIETG